MGANTKIEWCDHTFNHVRGCAHRILPDGTPHPGCDHCYAELLSKRNPGVLGQWGETGVRVCAAPDYWKLPIKWNRQAALDSCRRRVFCASLADVFEDWDGPIKHHSGSGFLFRSTDGYIVMDLPFGNKSATMDDLRRDLFAQIDATPNLDWLLLTKRPENIRAMWPSAQSAIGRVDVPFRSNVWIGTSISDQRTADEFTTHLFGVRDLCRFLFLSIEPFVGPINPTFLPHYSSRHGLQSKAVDWVIVGGESGHHARPMHPNWVRTIRDCCAVSAVPFFFKQWGEWVPADCAIDPKPEPTTILQGTPAECVVMRPPSRSICWVDHDGPVDLIAAGKFTGDSPRGVCMARVGKHDAGRLLDGRTWDEFPKVSQ